jgi:serine/threonine-protein kinase
MASKTVSLFDLAPGKVFHDRYKIVRANRQGGMSATFEVDDATSGAKRELQVFPAALFESVKQSAEFGETISQWRKVRSPAVLTLHDVHAVEDGTIAVVTDMPPGSSLREWQQKNGTMTPAMLVDVADQLLEGLAAIHGAGLVHGDIKPNTVYIGVSKKPHVMLVDGGITPALWSAKHLGDKTALIGTPFYAPVEQFGGESPDVQSDIYNVATVLFELVTGVIPWAGKSFLDVFQSKLAKTPPTMKSRAPKVSVPTELEHAIAGGLMADKKERYKSAEEFRERLAGAKKS